MTNPHIDAVAAEHFNTSARRLWVPLAELQEAGHTFQRHATSGRPKERDHPLAHRHVQLRELPPATFCPVPANRYDAASWTRRAPMQAIDGGFLALVQANPHLRPRIGNPDEMRSNRMQQTLEALYFRVTAPEKLIPEALDGAVITALNEEAVASAALANKGGINIIVTHTRPEPLLGVLHPLHTGPHTVALGFLNQGGTLNTAGMLFVNRCTWAHIVAEAVRLLGLVGEELLSPEEWEALAGKRSPEGIIVKSER